MGGLRERSWTPFLVVGRVVGTGGGFGFVVVLRQAGRARARARRRMAARGWAGIGGLSRACAARGKGSLPCGARGGRALAGELAVVVQDRGHGLLRGLVHVVQRL